MIQTMYSEVEQEQAEVIRELQRDSSREEIQRCYPVMRELRPHLQEPLFADQIFQQMREGYRLACLEVSGEVKALAGFRILTFLAWGKVLYIDDLVTNPTARRNGYAGKLLKWLISQAKIAGCDQLHLDSGHQRHDAHRLYLNHQMKIIAHHFSLDSIKTN
jgi:GNAT superfamily N-acetyltransferase